MSWLSWQVNLRCESSLLWLYMSTKLPIHLICCYCSILAAVEVVHNPIAIRAVRKALGLEDRGPACTFCCRSEAPGGTADHSEDLSNLETTEDAAAHKIRCLVAQNQDLYTPQKGWALSYCSRNFLDHARCHCSCAVVRRHMTVLSDSPDPW